MKRTVRVSKYRPDPILPFKTLDDEAEFWDTHDWSPLFKNSKTPLAALPLLESEKEEVMTVRLQRSVKKQIEQIARKMGINASTLSRMWLIEKLSNISVSR